jgi:hypothetical protein
LTIVVGCENSAAVEQVQWREQGPTLVRKPTMPADRQRPNF